MHPPYSVVLQVHYSYPPTRPNQFPVPGCTQNYTFSEFNTDPISTKQFTPPDNWLTKCTNSDQGIRKYNVPGRQDGYVCVSPGTKNAFEIALLVEPQQGNVILNLRLCGKPGDSCIDGARCKDCVHLNTTQLVFTPGNWSIPQTIQVEYKADGDTQFIFESPNYYLNNTYNSQFSTCACASGKCTNNCNMFCY